ncbi:hypothetical protein B7463_g9941, partial [Scytalidium lignicola]
MGRSQSLSIPTTSNPFLLPQMSPNSAVSYKKPIPPAKEDKALRLFYNYRQEEGLAQRDRDAQSSSGSSHLGIPGSMPSHGCKALSVSTSSIDIGDLYSVMSFTETDSQVSGNGREHIAFNGQKVKRRTRRKLTPLAKAKAALIRYLGSCPNCKAHAISCPLDHHDIESLERKARRMHHASIHKGSESSTSTAPAATTLTSINNAQNNEPPRLTIVNDQLFYPSYLIQEDLNGGLAADLAQIETDVAGNNAPVLSLTPTTPTNDLPPTRARQGPDMVHIGNNLPSKTEGWYFKCAHDTCTECFPTRPELETHFEIHEEYERLQNPVYNVCSKCRAMNQDEFHGYCDSLGCGGSMEVRVLGLRLSTQFGERYFPDSQAVQGETISSLYPDSYFSPGISLSIDTTGPGIGRSHDYFEYFDFGDRFDPGSASSNPESGSWTGYLQGSNAPGSDGHQRQRNRFNQLRPLTKMTSSVLYYVRKIVQKLRPYKAILLTLVFLIAFTYTFRIRGPLVPKVQTELPLITFQSPKLGFLSLMGSIPLFWSVKLVSDKRARSRRMGCPISRYSLREVRLRGFQNGCQPYPVDSNITPSQGPEVSETHTMDQRKEELGRRPVYIYDIPRDILDTLALRSDTPGAPSPESLADELAASKLQDESNTGSVGGSKACSLCGVAFTTLEDQRSHIRSDWHGYNLKLRLRGAKSVTEAEFEKLIGDLDESLSGSDSSDSDENEDGSTRKETILAAVLKKQAAKVSDNGDADDFVSKKPKRGSGKPPLYWLTTPTLPSNTYLGIYRAIFTNSEQNDESSIVDTIRKKQLSPKAAPPPADANSGVPLPSHYKDPHIFLCMIGGGHFAAMVVSLTPKLKKNNGPGPLNREATVLAHKTFHRYTTRRKQGGSQSANDNAKGAAHSAGSTLRRYNEQALTDDVRQLLQDWKDMINTSELLFIRATGNTNRRTLFGPYDDQVLRQNDPRIRGFPFNTRRATQNELMRSFIELTRVKVQEVDEAAIAAAAAAAAAAAEETARQSAIAKSEKQATSTPPKRSEEEDIALLHTTQIQALIRRSKFPALLSYFKSNDLSPDFPFYPPDSQQNHHTPTALHLAASQNSSPLVSGLLVKASANPTLVNKDGKTAYDLAGERSSRDAFRVARFELGESHWDWETAHVPAGISRIEADERDAREKKEEAQKEQERRKVEEARLREEGPKVGEKVPLGKAAGRGRAILLQKTAQEKREEESRGLTPEMKMKLEREKRARAAEERMRKMTGGG